MLDATKVWPRSGVSVTPSMMSSMDDLSLLRREFSAESGTFLSRLRQDLIWDKDAFTRLEQAMRRLCTEFEEREDLPRWIVEGFWQCADWVPAWTEHPNFPLPEPPAYYENAIKRLWDLQYWIVVGESAYLPEHVWEDL
jgi:hypothetical protein